MRVATAVYNLNPETKARRIRWVVAFGEHVLGALAIVVSGLILAGSLACAKPAPLPVPCPPPPTILRPPLRVRQLSPDATTRDVLEAYVLDLADQVGYADQLDALLDAYRPTPTPKEIKK